MMATNIRVEGAPQPQTPEGEPDTLTLEQMPAVDGGPVDELAIVDDEGMLEREKPATYVVYVWEENLPQVHPEIPQNRAASCPSARPLHGDLL